LTYKAAAEASLYRWEDFKKLSQEEMSWHVAAYLTKMQLQAVLQYQDFKRNQIKQTSGEGPPPDLDNDDKLWDD
jgi:hypothetical protein